MKAMSFKVMNEEIKKRLSSSDCFIANGYSFLKVFQHAMVFSMEEREDKLLPVRWRWPYLLLVAIEYIKAFRGRMVQRKDFRKILLIDPGRSFRDDAGTMHSVHLARIIGVLGRENVTVFSQMDTGRSYADYVLSDFVGRLPFPSRDERKMLRTVRKVYTQAAHSGLFSDRELEYISSALSVFYSGFRRWYFILKDSHVKASYLVCHYHAEDAIAAMKLFNIRVVEIQHGLISPNDIYYVYDKAFARGLKNAFFPDSILVYGPYWKEVLLKGVEFAPDSIVVAGNFRPWQAKQYSDDRLKENLILVCSQKGMAETYLAIAEWLSEVVERHPGWRVIVKLHPQEQQASAYHERSWPNVAIADPMERLDDLLARAKIQVTVYSTTLYDSLAFHTINFSVQGIHSADYAADMISENVALPIRLGEDVIARYNEVIEKGVKLLDTDRVYSPLNERVFD